MLHSSVSVNTFHAEFFYQREYKGVSESFRTGRLEQELQMV